MATGREIKNRIKSVSNTRKITRTMELVSTAKAKRAVDRVQGAGPYSEKAWDLVHHIVEASSGVDDPLLRKTEKVRKTGILLIGANRGLCGGYNNNVLRLAQNRLEEREKKGIEVELHVVGKKPASTLRFLGTKYEETYSHIEDKVSFDDAAKFADMFMEKFNTGALDEVEIVYTKYYSAGKQTPTVHSVLPLSIAPPPGPLPTSGEGEGSASEPGERGQGNFLFEPQAETMLSSLLPKVIRVSFLSALLHAAASEQIARRVAMKNATDAAGDMLKDMTLQYNRARQAKITQEIAEIVGGAAANE